MPVIKHRRAIIFALIFGILMLSSLARSQEKKQDPPKKEEEMATIRLDTDLVTLEVAVTDRDGKRSNTGLRAEDFVIYEDGVRQKVASFQTADVPFNLVLLMDTSGSTRDDVGLMRRAALRFLDELRPQDRLAVVQFNKQVELLKDLTASHAKIEEALSLLKPGTGTSFYDALQLTVDDVFGKVEGRKAIIALTDGVDSYGYQTYEEILPVLEKNNISLYFLELDTESFTEAGMKRDCTNESHFEFSSKQLTKFFQDHGRAGAASFLMGHCTIPAAERVQINHLLYASARRELREMADKTGGRVYPVKQLQQLDAVYAQIAAELHTLYSVAYYPANEKHDGKWRKIRVEVKRPGFTARTRSGYRAPLN
ncbi:MAG TPA: VWA domain-containing protein [Blastocatellia bacterium]|nr:VWA domain-containing protein [Blastocatellia bacterium]HMX26614.1 VWA domain-containing protein [Blastocatellia bacterium]HMY72702.1 VWA domain-containing protein [Blastocatellia bacterium]HNG32604.1 VWA domain-containing protein [Blastocatellia bacterium]